MKSPDIKNWSIQKNEEYYSLALQLLNIADGVSEFHIREFQSSWRYSIGLTESLIQANLFRMKTIQLDRTIESIGNLARLQKRIKNKLDYVKNKAQMNAMEYKSNSVALVTEFIEEGDRKHPLGTKYIADAIKVASDMGERAYRTAEIAVDVLAENTDTYLDKYIDE